MSKNKTIFIYRATNLINGKLYIGQTINLNKRIMCHLREKKSKSILTIALKKYGLQNFKFEVIDSSMFPDVANEMEIYYIKHFNSKKPNGYNITDGGCGSHGRKHSEKSKKKISIGRIGKYAGENHPLYGKHHTDESKEKMRIGHLGKYDGKNNPMFGVHRYGKNSPHYGKKHSEETKEKMRQAKAKRKAFNLTKIMDQANESQS